MVTATECQGACQARLNCSHWTWNSATNTCWLKSSDEGRMERKGKVSGPRECTEVEILKESDITASNANKRVRRAADCFDVGFTYPGQGMKDNMLEGVENPESCQVHCQSREGCKYWTWNSANFSRLVSARVAIYLD